jgi:predicted nucleotidyltransferase
MSAHIQIPRSQIDSFCRSWQVSELALFGSVLREDFGPDSDVDVLIQFQPQARHTLLDMARMEEELRQIFGRDVDLVERSAVEQSRNHIRREAILQSAESVHAAWR